MIFIFGNGLSIGFDSRLATGAITARVNTALGSSYAEVLSELAELGTREDADAAPIGVDRGNFEQLAGPVDRLADALVAVQRLFAGPSASPVLAKLQDAGDVLRRIYLRVVGTVLREIDLCCVDDDSDEERPAAWQKMNAFARELIQCDATVFTLNYDSLLMSALLKQGVPVYDGFPTGVLDVPLDRWPGRTALYQLHGSAGWHRDAGGVVRKSRLEGVRAEGLLGAWAAECTDRGLPAVILGDLKMRYTEQSPFSTLYEELHRQLLTEQLIVVGGYSFGDRPLNRALARYLSHRPQNRLLVWDPSDMKDMYVERLRKQLLEREGTISAGQVNVEKVWLPHAGAVAAVARR